MQCKQIMWYHAYDQKEMILTFSAIEHLSIVELIDVFGNWWRRMIGELYCRLRMIASKIDIHKLLRLCVVEWVPLVRERLTTAFSDSVCTLTERRNLVKGMMVGGAYSFWRSSNSRRRRIWCDGQSSTERNSSRDWGNGVELKKDINDAFACCCDGNSWSVANTDALALLLMNSFAMCASWSICWPDIVVPLVSGLKKLLRTDVVSSDDEFVHAAGWLWASAYNHCIMY